MKYTTEEKADAGGVQGGLLHFLMQWSLSTQQERELRSKVRTQCKAGGKPGELVGPVELDQAADASSFRIVSAVLEDESMRKSLVSSGRAPTYPGGKVSAAASLDKYGAQLFLATVEKSKSIADLSVALDYKYRVQMPGAKGEIIYHWDRMQEVQKTFEGKYEAERSRKKRTKKNRRDYYRYENPFVMFVDDAVRAKGLRDDYRYTDTETRRVFDTMIEQGVVQFNFEPGYADDEYSAKIIDAMHQVFVNRIMEPADEAPALAEDQGNLDVKPITEPNLDLEKARKRTYIVKRDEMASKMAVKKEVIRLDYGVAVERQHQMVANVASWYDANKDNRKCVQQVNLNDPFFSHRDIRFIVDLEARSIFEDMVNYVTVNVRKRRGRGNPFEQSVTIDQDYLKNRGVVASMTYAREGDRNSEVYQYQAQWSLRGGNLFPANPQWQQGKWEGVTLAPPVERWDLEVEADLDQMEASDIARVTAEIHYPLFGEEQFTTIAVSPRGEALETDAIYVDRGTRGFAYRLIVNHKKEGRMVLPWEKRLGDRYIYAVIPDEILVESPARQTAKDAARKLGKIGAEKVLDQFQDLFAQAD